METVNYYELLELERGTSDKDAIKKAYRKQALKYHPDKVGSDPENVARFQAINRAHEVLSDDKKRSIYDRYGQQGVDMMETLPFLDAEMILTMNKTFAVATLFVVALLLFPIFVALRADGQLSWSWLVVFVPAFAAMGGIIMFVALSPTSDDEEEKEKSEGEKKKDRLIMKSVTIAYVACILAILILLALALQGTLQTWWAVFAPWYLLELFHISLSLRSLYTKIRLGLVVSAQPAPNADDDDNEAVEIVTRPFTTLESSGMIAEEVAGWGLRIAQFILLPLKLNNPDIFSWTITFLPAFLIGGLHFISIVFGCVAVRSDSSVPAEVNQSRRGSLTGRLIGLLIIGALAYTTIGLLIKRLNAGDSPSSGVILIPVFLVLSLALLVVGCCLPCMLYLMQARLESEMAAQEAGQSMRVVASDRRITN